MKKTPKRLTLNKETILRLAKGTYDPPREPPPQRDTENGLSCREGLCPKPPI